MPAYRTEHIRNIALVGHSGAGKTTLFEALLHAGGTLQTAGSVERGTTVSDYDPMEKERQHSIQSALASIDHGGMHVNLFDTPGYPDFRGPTLSILGAVETCAVVVNAALGIEHSTLRLMDYTKARRLCRLIIVHKIDHADSDLELLVEQLRETFGSECLPINLPAKVRSQVVDCFFNPSGESDFSTVADAHHRISDQVLVTLWLSGRRRWHQILYVPALEIIGRDLTVCTVDRRGDGVEDEIAQLEQDLIALDALVESYKARLLAGCYPVEILAEAAAAPDAAPAAVESDSTPARSIAPGEIPETIF